MNAANLKPVNLSRFHVNHLLLAAWILLLVILFVLAIDSIISKPGGDSAIFIYVAKGILEGDIPYLHRWDHKGPLLYVLNLFGLLIHDTWGLWLVQGVFLLGASTFAFLALRKPFGTPPALFAIALFLSFFSRFVPPGNFTEQYGLLFQFLTLYLFLRSQEQPNPAPSQVRFASLHLAIGALGAASFLLRPNLVALWIVIGLYWLFLRGSSLRKLAWAVIGGTAILFAVAALFAAVGALGALWEAVIIYNFAHSDASLLDRLGVVRHLFEQLFPITLLIVAAWCIGVFSLFRRNVMGGSYESVLPLTLSLLPLEVISLSLSGFGFPHYYLTALPVFTLLLAYLAWFVLRQLPIPHLFLSLLLLLGVVSYSLPLSNIGRLEDKYLHDGVLAEDNESRLADRIIEATDPGDRILVWGKGARIYLLSDREAPTRFFYHHPLIKPSLKTQSMRDEFFTAIEANLPILIVNSGDQRFPPLERAKQVDWQPTNRRYLHDLRDFEPFLNLVEQHYIAVGAITPFTIYSLRSDDSVDLGAARGELIIRSTYDVYLDGRTLTYVKTPCTQDDAAKRFILHVIPFDKSVIGGNEHANLDFNFVEGMNWKVGEGCIVSQMLPEYPIASIRTGQYNTSRSGHDWLSDYQLPQRE